MKVKNKCSFPGKIIELLWTDDEFYRKVVDLKKGISVSFPKMDQWSDEEGFHLCFALAGYSPDDVEVSYKGSVIFVSSQGSKEDYPDVTAEETEAEVPLKEAKKSIQQGFIVRGIARRSFYLSYFISDDFDVTGSMANMENGLLHIVVPRKEEEAMIKVDINVKRG